MPDKPIIARQTYAAPLSFIGSTRRAIAWVRRVGTTRSAAGLATLLVLILLPAAWLVIAAWYVVIFGLFGVFTFPYRLIRRSQRKSLHSQQAQLATMQVMLLNQQQALAQSQQRQIEP
jgi:fatty acid desaturase